MAENARSVVETGRVSRSNQYHRFHLIGITDFLIFMEKLYKFLEGCCWFAYAQEAKIPWIWTLIPKWAAYPFTKENISNKQPNKG